MIRTCIALGLLCLVGCMSQTAYAPVIDGWKQPLNVQGLYKVRRGDSLYSIAWAYGLDYRKLATINHVSPPYEIRIGDHLKLVSMRKQRPVIARKPAQRAVPRTKVSVPRQRIVRPSLSSKVRWHWPAAGKVVQGMARHRQGIDIAGRLAEPVRAAAAGKVVYSGNGLKGYGNLIIIKHSEQFLSAYAFNLAIKVREGAHVIAGQPIATMGVGHGARPLLHFEIRDSGRPVPPLKFLPTKVSRK